jgi:hypothetical protein
MMIVHNHTADKVVEINQLICADRGYRHQCYGIGKVESALHSSFYPGDDPFQHGGVACLADTLCFPTQAPAFYDGNKRTASNASLTFLDLNGWDLKYPMDVGGKSAVADIIERCADGKLAKDEMIEWLDR